MRTRIFVPFALLVFAASGFGQPRVSPRNLHERVLCVVPMVGAGTPEDPRRPMFAPLPPQPGELPSRAGILAFTYQESDDGKFALVEFVAANRSAFATILNGKRPDVKAFVRGVARRAEIETEFRRFKRDFHLDRFGVTAP